MSRDDSRAGTDADCASPRSSAGGDDCWDMAEGDNDALTKVVMQKLSRCVSLCVQVCTALPTLTALSWH